ncbi:hypothetical protein K4L44_07825 [Halosquirtibacter laminarini]|uniref:Uncharacterized protein n=1 Tax=Halosquirtibacter laminarini TaxID=3374600 RepID=A0AC61NJ40_9BACT|nr:hypothetical protein K4L44_07825 [Prolixibacteraceae bacterium]
MRTFLRIILGIFMASFMYKGGDIWVQYILYNKVSFLPIISDFFFVVFISVSVIGYILWERRKQYQITDLD